MVFVLFQGNGNVLWYHQTEQVFWWDGTITALLFEKSEYMFCNFLESKQIWCNISNSHLSRPRKVQSFLLYQTAPLILTKRIFLGQNKRYKKIASNIKTAFKCPIVKNTPKITKNIWKQLVLFINTLDYYTKRQLSKSDQVIFLTANADRRAVIFTLAE